MMKVDNPLAFRFILHDELYLLPEDKVASPIAAPEVTSQVPASAELPPAPPVNQAPIAATPVIPQAVKVTEPANTATPMIPQPIQTPRPEFNYLGGNNKHFVILVNYAADEHIPAAHLAALESMLKRKDLGLDDVAIFNMHQHQPLAIAKVAEWLKPLKMVIMGKDALPQGIGNLPFNSPVQGKKTTVLYSFGFDEMMSSNENKKAFWDQMKTL
ncbi:hypothetical protein [Mucilaginibacter psychrotolerans]|uniref:Uncharacterized protein n=1 Tax=Mucilaginibacter psychrotolerans TaxID=1524096 RepID=A0A4Y8SIZ7_9SPHI|nr:hypothetical protein [Mucilaginibacter psychrotolerans]TFF38434.1 hypothetical protein E2R66_08170 [Mucilaginibacter psychrotolerans]